VDAKDAGAGALETADGRALTGELTEMLEAELVRFAHRVDHEHRIELDRARASLAVMTMLLRGGVTWRTRSDCAPGRLADAFTVVATRDGADPALVKVLQEEVDAFLAVADAVTVVDRPARSLADLLRKVGAAPETWFWARDYGADVEKCWRSCGAADRLVQVALAIGVEGDAILRAMAGAFTVAATRAKTNRTGQRNDLVALLGRLAAAGGETLARDKELVAKVTALAFEMAAVQQGWWAGSDKERRRATPDGIGDVAVLTFQLAELFGANAAKRVPDVERYGELAGRADKSLSARGLRLGALLQRELEAAFAAALELRKHRELRPRDS
jgi:hypothetical protein